MTGVVALLVAGIVALSPPLVAGDAHAHRRSAPGTKLGDGFVVAEGTRLVGAVFPDYRADRTDRDHPTLRADGWFALLQVDGDVATAFEDYRRQATAAGYQETNPRSGGHGPEPCAHRTTGDTCILAFRRDDTLVELRVRTCGTCNRPVASGTVVSTRLTSDDAAAPPESIDAKPVTLATELTVQELAAAKEVPAANGQIFPDGSLAQSPYVPEDVAPDSTVLGRAQYLDVCERDFAAVVKADRRPRHVFDEYTQRFVTEAPQIRKRATFRSAPVRVASDGSWTTTLLDPPGARAPLILIDWCG